MLLLSPKPVVELNEEVVSHFCPWNVWVKGGRVLSWAWRQPHPLPLTQLLSLQRWGWAGDSFPRFSSPLVLWGQHMPGPSALPGQLRDPNGLAQRALHQASGSRMGASALPMGHRPYSLLYRGTRKTVLQQDACSRAVMVGAFGRDLWAGDPGEWHLIHFPTETSASDQAFTVISTWSLSFVLMSPVTSSLSGRKATNFGHTKCSWWALCNCRCGHQISPTTMATCPFLAT